METTRPAGGHDFADELLVLPRKAEDPRILSIGQQRLWYLNQLSPNNSAYNVPYASRIRGHIDVPALQKALDAVVKRHEVLRTVVLAPGGNPVPVLALEIETSSGEACYFEYCTDFFKEQPIAKMVEDFQSILGGLIAETDR